MKLSETKNKLPRELNSKDIIRGRVLNVPIPFNDGRPCDFVVYDESKNMYNIIPKDDGFEGKLDEKTNKIKSEVVKLAINYKLRPAIVIQNDFDNKNLNYNSVVVLPIESIKEKQKENPRFKRMISHNDIMNVHYIGYNSYVIVNNPVKINKNMLFKNNKNIIISQSTMDNIMIKFAKCFDIEEIEKCDECMYNYEKYINASEEVAASDDK